MIVSCETNEFLNAVKRKAKFELMEAGRKKREAAAPPIAKAKKEAGFAVFRVHEDGQSEQVTGAFKTAIKAESEAGKWNIRRDNRERDEGYVYEPRKIGNPWEGSYGGQSAISAEHVSSAKETE